MRIAGIQGLSLIDYPDNVAAVLFLAGCDFRCPFCQNKDLVVVDSTMPQFGLEETFEILLRRKNFIDGVAITGGEPLLFPEVLNLVERLHTELELKVKVDTNGNHPDLLRRLLDGGHVHFVAMDLKTAPSRYAEAAGKLVDWRHIEESIGILMNGGVDYEFRTTVVPGFVDEAAIDEMGPIVQDACTWAFQQFLNRGTFDERFTEVKPFVPERVRELAMRAEPFVKQVIVRGI